MSSKSPVRSMEDVDATALSYAEVKMLATGDPRIKQKMDLDIQVTKLKMLKANHNSQKYEMEDKVRVYYPNKIKETQLYIDCLSADLPIMQSHPVKDDAFSITILGKVFTERKDAGEAIIKACKSMTDPDKPIDLGKYRGFPMRLCFDEGNYKIKMKQHLTYTVELSDDKIGNITRINNALEKIPQSIENHKRKLETLQVELESAKEEAARPFLQESELAEKSAVLAKLNIELGSGYKDNEQMELKNSEAPEEKSNRPSVLKKLQQYEQAVPGPVAEVKNHAMEAVI